ncbi:conserved hypothetical protein [Formosa agariphila KMM 3901]|uniref:Uncharacterized protein n=1 Tax=Formosa agariphila (strain DSM 15362 / KCTC 12365 / LMG 23005 / KMM 3901 / M-2Alg 35-1) TaxID=1347342 RepID=T2KRX3_FORAG|nr:hypothetical protein [Formosa agariphila]CDF81256.1 conserved hypothetical protein [Formosa agariphila KMM 3901]
MKTQEQLLKNISDTVWGIENDYPEIYKHLNENPMTIPEFKNPEVTTEDLKVYLKSLKVIIKRYKEEQHLK